MTWVFIACVASRWVLVTQQKRTSPDFKSRVGGMYLFPTPPAARVALKNQLFKLRVP